MQGLYFQRHKVHADIYGGFVVRGLKRQWGCQTSNFFCNFGHHIFGTFKDNVNIIMQWHEIYLVGFPVTIK